MRARRLATGRWKANCYIVSADADAIVVDPGDDPAAILEACEGLTVAALALTHGHYDHVGAAAAIQRATGAPCFVHGPDLALLRQAPAYALSFDRISLSLPPDIRTFADGAHIAAGGVDLEVRAGPGHTAGSVCFTAEDIVLTGDTLLREKVGRTDLPGADRAQLEASIERLLAELPGATRILPGHGPEWTAEEAAAWWTARSTR